LADAEILQKKFFLILTESKEKKTLIIKGLVHPKMKILSVFTHPHVVPNLYVFIITTIVGKNTYYGSQWGMRSV